eukprot:1160556-Pelagomonas_calceolata.AAC.7
MAVAALAVMAAAASQRRAPVKEPTKMSVRVMAATAAACCAPLSAKGRWACWGWKACMLTLRASSCTL